jgi:hypothetical protein
LSCIDLRVQILEGRFASLPEELSMSANTFAPCAFAALLCAACAGETTDPTPGDPSGASTSSGNQGDPGATSSSSTGAGGGSNSNASASGTTASSSSGVGSGGGTSMPNPVAATLTGTVDAAAQPSAGGLGDLYVVVMDDNPINGGGNMVGGQIIENVNFATPAASYGYTISDIPPSSTTLYVTAFLDDNGNANPGAPQPDKGDLVAMQGISFPTIVIDQANDYALDLTLSIAMPF